MSFQEYVDHISQKYRLAVAISVIKTKPNHLSIDEYLTQLQNKIKDKEFDPNETVCSDDFNFDDDEILKENTQAENSCDALNETRLGYSVNENESEGSQTILNDFVFGDGTLEPSVEGETCIGNTIRLLKEVTTITHEEDHANQNLSQLTFCESQEAIGNANNYITHCYDTTKGIEDNNTFIQNGDENCMDSQETELYTLRGFTQDFTHVSQTQNEYFVIADKYIRNKGNSSNIQDNAKDINGQKGYMQMYVTRDQNKLAITVDGRANIGQAYLPPQNENECGNTKPSQFLENVKEYTADNKNSGLNDDKSIGEAAKNINEVDIQDVSNTQKFAININNVLAIDKAAIHNYTEEAARKVTSNNIIETNICTATKDTDTPFISFNSQSTLTNEFTVCNEMQDHTEHKNSDSKGHDTNKQIAQTNQNSLNIENVQQEFNDNIENNDMELDETASDENTQEKVPFKVIEEFNRVKNFVNKKDKRYDGCSTDSGYRSDSQLRSSLKTASQHGAWLNQSAHCLFKHILQAAATDDIVKQIAQILGKLIDKLHEEENYPPFLEELLETVDSTLLDMRVGGGWADDVLITKDDNIQRLLLLNKSKHILKYTIEKITGTLEELHTNLTQENLYELTNIVEVENVCYIFHTLELLLKRYMKIKDVSIQSTQNSQEELTTRSSLTELWRKKWYPDNKEVMKNEIKKCILKRCRDILNKIIVECMDGYSLVAFAALQCFNLIQG